MFVGEIRDHEPKQAKKENADVAKCNDSVVFNCEVTGANPKENDKNEFADSGLFVLFLLFSMIFFAKNSKGSKSIFK